MDQLKLLKRDCIETLLQLYKKANAGHIGSSLSCLDILLYLFDQQIKVERGDQLVLSKGHAAGALYVVLSRFGLLSEDLQSFYQDGTLLAAHPPCTRKIEAIPFGTGSLGHGLSLATGIAFAQKFESVTTPSQRQKKVFSVLSDGECNEGSTWEAALFAGHHKLRNLVVCVDANGLQGLGATRDILDLEPFEAKWKAFNFDTYVIEDGNNFNQLHEAFQRLENRSNDQPVCLIARTCKGAGVSFMENQFQWHYLSMNDQQFQEALREIRESNA
jgi:transketolase